MHSFAPRSNNVAFHRLVFRLDTCRSNLLCPALRRTKSHPRSRIALELAHHTALDLS